MGLSSVKQPACVHVVLGFLCFSLTGVPAMLCGLVGRVCESLSLPDRRTSHLYGLVGRDCVCGSLPDRRTCHLCGLVGRDVYTIAMLSFFQGAPKLNVEELY